MRDGHSEGLSKSLLSTVCPAENEEGEKQALCVADRNGPGREITLATYTQRT